MGSLLVRNESVPLHTTRRVELIDLTAAVAALVRESGVREGAVSIWSMHTTCALFINEVQDALHVDILRFLEEIAPREKDWRHNDPAHSDCDRSNTDSHLRAMLLGHSVTAPVTGGELVLGQWQRILAGEMDGPRARTVRVQVMGVGEPQHAG